MASLPFPFLSFHIIFLLTSTGQTGTPISMVDGSNDAFPPKEVPFGVSLQKFDLTGSVTPKNRQKVGVVYGFSAKLGESAKNHISVNQQISTQNLNCRWQLKLTHYIPGQRSSIIKSKMAAAAIMKKFKL
jgi:hypothetical protein